MFRRTQKALALLKTAGPVGLVSYVRHRIDHSAAVKRMDSVANSDMPIADKFSAIYSEKLWLKVHRGLNEDESLSGHGSTLVSTKALRAELETFLSNIGAKRFLDAPCGDLNWMTEVALPEGCSYIGGDVVASLIDKLKSKYGNSGPVDRTFMVLDLTKDTMPDVNAWLCRDCLQHLSHADVAAVLRNAIASNIEYFLLTNHYNVDVNTDIATGQYRRLDLTKAPFNFPEPSLVLKDENIDAEPHYIGVWRRQDLLGISPPVV